MSASIAISDIRAIAITFGTPPDGSTIKIKSVISPTIAPIVKPPIEVGFRVTVRIVVKTPKIVPTINPAYIANPEPLFAVTGDGNAELGLP